MKVCSIRLSPFQFAILVLLQLGGVTPGLAQRDYTVIKPRERAANENVTLSRRATQASKGILGVFLEPIIAGKIIVTDTQGRILDEAETDNLEGKAEFELRRGQSYIIKASSPGFLAKESRVRLLKSGDIVRLSLQAQFARLDLPGLPPGAQVFIDGQPTATADQTGQLALTNLAPGTHTLLVRHPDYNDYEVPLSDLEAGTSLSFPSLSTLLIKVAKLTIQSLPGAQVFIDGEVRGKVAPDGQVRIDYQLTQAAEHTITVEALGYQPWTSKALFKPGPLTLSAKLDPIITSAGLSDFFDNLSLWHAPPSWKIINEKTATLNKNKLQVSGAQLGWLKDKTYRDFKVVFTVWLKEGKGATWAVRTDKTGRNYYLFHLAGPHATGLPQRRLFTYRVKDGQRTEVSTPTPLTLDFKKYKEDDGWYVEITVTGNAISHKITDAYGELSEASFTDTEADRDLFLFGTFGFLSLNGEAFLIDDLTIVPPEKN